MGLLWSRRFDGGKGEVKETNIPLDGSSMHVSQFDRSTNSRNSWDTHGHAKNAETNVHYTNQKIKRGRPGRHEKG